MSEPSAASQNARLKREIARRRTFAIISHPDAGKTTMTEKLLLYGGALRQAGSVKAKKAGSAHAVSDWMEMEKERGISVSSSVLQFDYDGCHINLLDTPGHNDFSEDTYRTLAAADCALMLIDSVKGVEPQTIKLFKVCSMRGIPIVTFINKLDRLGREPLDLLDEIEKVLGIPATAVNWPIGAGPNFQGVYDRWNERLIRFQRSDGGSSRAEATEADLESMRNLLGERSYTQLEEELELLDMAGNPFDQEAFLAGKVTPVFFGSAITNFGVEPFLEAFLQIAPAPRPRPTIEGEDLQPADSDFTGFVFKIQANMDPRHRDRVAFVRICSGRFERGMKVTHVRTERDLHLNKPLMFMAQDRSLVDEAFSGDIIGLWDPGLLKIGDSLCEGAHHTFEGIPRFSPEHFVRVRLKDPLKRKQLKKGLEQLSEEGAVQVFYHRERLERDPVLGAVGVLQFEVVQHRLENEYNVRVIFDRLPYGVARWVEGDTFDPALFETRGDTACFIDVEERPLVVTASEWMMQRLERQFDKLTFIAAVQPGRVQKG